MNDAFEKQLRDAWAKQTFPVDPDHRAAMEELLRTRDRRRPLIFWWLGGLLLLVVGAAGLVWFATRQVADTSSGADARMDHEAASALPDRPVARDAQSVLGTPAVNPESASSAQSTLSPDQAKVQDESSKSGPSDRISRPQVRQPSARPDATSKGRKTDSARQPGIADAGNISTEPGKAAIAADQAEFGAVTAGTRADEAVGRGDMPAQSTTHLTDKTSDADASLRSLITVASIPALNVTRIETGSPEVIAATGITSPRRWYLFAETAGTYIPANEPQSPAGWQLHAGAGAGFGLATRLEGLVSAGYMVQDGGFSFSKSSTVRQLGFGVRSAFNTLAPDRLHHLYVKAGVQYRLRRHILSARAGICYLYGAQGDITVVQADQLSAGTVEQTSYAWVNTDGLRRWFGVADLGYGYQLTPRLSALAGLTWRPSAVEQDQASLAADGYTLEGNTPAWQGFLSLQYRFYGHR